MEDAQSWSAGDLVEIANLIADARRVPPRARASDRGDLARRTLDAGTEFRKAALYTDQVISRENGKATAATWSAITSLLRKASTLDKASEKLAGSVLAEE